MGSVGDQGHLSLLLALLCLCSLLFAGMAALLNLAITIFTQEPQLCLGHLSQHGSILMLILKHLLSPSFLHHLSRA